MIENRPSINTTNNGNHFVNLTHNIELPSADEAEQSESNQILNRNSSTINQSDDGDKSTENLNQQIKPSSTASEEDLKSVRVSNV